MIAPEVCERLHTALHLLFTDFSARRKGDYAVMKIVVAFILATLIAMPALAAGKNFAAHCEQRCMPYSATGKQQCMSRCQHCAAAGARFIACAFQRFAGV